MKRKRVYSPGSSWGSKRRRTGKRVSRFKRRARTTNTLTSQSGVGRKLQYRGRRLRKRAIRSILWRDTVFKPHYRSVSAVSSTISSPASNNTATNNRFPLLNYGGGAFWTTAGGTKPMDAGGAVPGFVGDVVIRGGIVGATITNAATDPVMVNLYYLWSIARPDFTLISGTVSVGYDPSIDSDVTTDVGRIYWSSSVLLTPGQVYKFERRLRPTKLDQHAYLNGGNSPQLLVSVNDTLSATASQIRVTTYYNLSFTAESF